MSDPATERFERAALQAAAIIKEELGADVAGLLVGGSVARGVAMYTSGLPLFLGVLCLILERKGWMKK